MKTKTKSLLYSNAKSATLKEIRALKIGDVIECYYPDSETPRLEIVQATWCVSKRGDAGDLMTIPVSHLGLRNNDNVSALNNLRTDKFKKVGYIEIVFDQTLNLKAPMARAEIPVSSDNA